MNNSDLQKTEEAEVVAEDEGVEEEKESGNDEFDDTKPIRVNDLHDAGGEIWSTAKEGVLKPVYRLGWRYIRGGKAAAKSFIEGALNDKGGKR